MYLNANVYINTPKYADAMTYSKKVIDAGYSLMPNYQWLFLADNDVNNTEVIWSLNYDGVKSQSYGGATFIINGTCAGGTPIAEINGLGGWGAMRATEKIPVLFPDFTGTIDKRSLWYTPGQTLEMDDFFEYEFGYPTTKFRNRTRSGGFGNDPNRTFADIDIPVSRLAEMYLIYAEAAKRANDVAGQALGVTYINLLRQRAYGNNLGNITVYDEEFILEERARELYWEGFRRMDLIRYNRYAEGTYLWPWKGGLRNGTAFDPAKKILPIPSKQLAANPKLKQNPGY
jgi:hypothetical protein